MMKVAALNSSANALKSVHQQKKSLVLSNALKRLLKMSAAAKSNLASAHLKNARSTVNSLILTPLGTTMTMFVNHVVATLKVKGNAKTDETIAEKLEKTMSAQRKHQLNATSIQLIAVTSTNVLKINAKTTIALLNSLITTQWSHVTSDTNHLKNLTFLIAVLNTNASVMLTSVLFLHF
jgi:hypothetical protein